MSFGRALLAFAALTWCTAAAAQEDVPQEWLDANCAPSSYDGNNGCDCGCAVADPDCEDQTAASCYTNNCFGEGGTNPASDDNSTCVENACGDGYVGGDETCDDADGEGCSEDCATVADGFTCSYSGGGCHRVNVCGDGFTDDYYSTWEGTEECDDGNTDAGDGCAADCTIEAGFTCDYYTGACRAPTCGDGFVDYWEDDQGNYLYESCDDGDATSGDGCSADCMTIEEGYACDRAGHPCRMSGVCGDGYVDWLEADMMYEACDDLNTGDGDGCAADCRSVEEGWACPYYQGGACHQIVCGDGNWDAGEECEDGDADGGDGCATDCTVEDGWSCTYEFNGGSYIAVCHQIICGDGVYDSYDWTTGETLEACEDGNTTPGDGCDASCAVETGWTCDYYSGGDCHQVVCGDGTYDYDVEGCEDGNTTAGDGCSPDCAVEDGWECDWYSGGDCVQIPDGWTCSGSYYGTADGCDCGCGIVDPDCADATGASCEYNNCEGEEEPNAANNAVCGGDAPPPADGGTGPDPEPTGDGGTLDPEITPDGGSLDRAETTLFGDCSATTVTASSAPLSLALLGLVAGLAARRRRVQP